MKLTKRQLFLLHTLHRHDGENTHQINSVFGGNSSYESNLRDRLFTLASHGVVAFEEKKSGKRHVIARTWKITDAGKAVVNSQESPKFDVN